MVGLVVGVPLFIFKEVTGLWESWGLPAIHYTIMSSIMMGLGIVVHLGASALTRQPVEEDTENLVWSGEETRHIFSKLERPIWTDRTLWAGFLALCTAGFVIWWW